METERLYEKDVHLRTFTAQVLACQAGKHGYHVVLDRTAFYPEGGGQPGDQGTLDGVAVTDVHTVDGEIVHYLEKPLEVGATVTGVLDYDRRFALMQQHSGEHIVSGLIFSHYGLHNVGFHMGRDAVTIDFDGFLTDEQLKTLELEANQAIWADLPVEVLWPDRETLAQLPYRSKKVIAGAVRLVRMGSVDLCACCGVHVTHTGEIGLIKFLSSQRFHEGVRIEMLAGAPAYAHLAAVWQQNKSVSGQLSAKPLETAKVVSKLRGDLEEAKQRAAQLEEQLFSLRAQAFSGAGDVLLIEDKPLKPDSLRRLADAVQTCCGGRCAVFAPTADGYAYALGQPGGDLRALVKRMNQALSGRGGGKAEFAQGSVRADRAAIEAFFREETP